MQSTSERLVTLSPLAVERVKGFISKDKNPEMRKANGLRIFIAQGGCSGYQYGMVLEDHAREDDITWADDGINVYVDNQSAQFLRGASIDFVETVQGAGFKIDNPNAVSSCGCGNSFQTAASEEGHSHGEAEGCACGCGGH
jgi:iron-sulfur cluster assembly accessory protein